MRRYPWSRARRIFVALGVLIVVGGGLALAQSTPTTGPAPSSEPAPSNEPAPLSFKVVVDQVVALFPLIRTDVVEVAGTRVTLASGRAEGLQPRVELVAFREGREIIHPTTRKSLGHVEDEIGRLVVAEVFENYSIATQIDGSAIQAGDKARVSSGKIPLTVVTLSSGASSKVVEAASSDIIRELERTARFQIAIGDPIAVWLDQEKIAPADFLAGRGVKEAAQRFRAKNVLALNFRLVERKPYMDVRFFSGAFDTPNVSTSLLVPPSVTSRPSREFSSGGAAGTVQIVKRSLLTRLLSGNFEPNAYSAGAASIPLKSLATFPFPIISMDVAVAPGDKIPRIAITEGQRVFLYRLKDQTLEPEWTFDRMAVGKILTVQLADLDRDGILEVVVNRQDYKAGMIGYILTTDKGGRPKVLVDDIPVLMLAVDETGEGVNRVLFTQVYDREKFWTPGAVMRYVLKPGAKDITPSGKAYIHDGFRAAGATFSNIGGKDVRVMAFVDEANRLRFAAHGEELWRSLTSVGGGLARGMTQQWVGAVVSAVDKYFKIEPNPLSVDLDGDGVQEVVIPINDEEAGKMAVVFRGPTGYRMQVVSAGFEGMITGLGAIPGEGAAAALVAAVVRRTGVLRQDGETQLIMTLPE